MLMLVGIIVVLSILVFGIWFWLVIIVWKWLCISGLYSSCCGEMN